MSSGWEGRTDVAEEMRPEQLVVLAEQHPLAAAERIMRLLRSPAGCPWDREQSFDSIRRHTLEEVYEVFDAIERRAWPELEDELGDLLLQVLFYAQMAAEEGRFDLSGVARALCRKLIRRHPHIFADVSVAGSAEVKRNWDEIKRQEHSEHGSTDPESLLDCVPRSMPALMEACKLGSAAAKVGFDWSDAAGVVNKVREELAELEQELHANAGTDARTEAIEDELGDVLFSVCSLARHLHADPEMALRRANVKFRDRFVAMEAIAREHATPLKSRSPDELEALWLQAKRQLANDRAVEAAPR